MSRAASRAVAAAGCAAMLAASVSACSSAERLTTGMKVRNAVVKLGDQPAATVVASVDASPEQAREFIAKARGGKHEVPEKAALRLARAELTLSAGTDDGEEEIPLKEMPNSEAANVAAALNFGGKDVAAVKSVDDKLYLKADLPELVDQTEGSKDARAKAEEIVDVADDLPSTLGAAQDALKGEWVRADPAAFDDFARAAEVLAERQREITAEKAEDEKAEDEKEREKSAGEQAGPDHGAENEDAEDEDAKDEEKKAEKRREKKEREAREQRRRQAERARELRDAITVGSALDGQSQREFVSRVQDLLREHAKFDARGERGGADHVRMTLPGRDAAKDLVGALHVLGAEIDPKRVPRGDIAADLAIRRGQLTTLTLDLGQFTRGGDAHLPLSLEFSGGDAVAVTAPGGTEELEPQDLVAAMMYGALGTERF